MRRFDIKPDLSFIERKQIPRFLSIEFQSIVITFECRDAASWSQIRELFF